MADTKITFGEIWKTLYALDICKHIEKKNGLSYISWIRAWKMLVEVFPNSSYKFIYNEDTKMPYFRDEHGAFVKTEVIVEGFMLPMQLPIMDYQNKPMRDDSYEFETNEYVNGKRTGKKIKHYVDSLNSFAINKNHMRCLAKNIAMFGLGAQLYEGDDIPDDEDKINELWESGRNKPIGGTGKNKDKTFAEVPTSYLNWCVNSSYKSLKTRAEKEYEYRKVNNISITEDGEVKPMFTPEKKDTSNDENNVVSVKLTKRIGEVLKESDDLFIKKFANKNPKMHGDYKKAIANSKSIDSVNFISLQIKAMTVIYNALKDKSLDVDTYKANFKLINKSTIENLKDMEGLMTDILNSLPSGSKNEAIRDSIIKSLQDEIDKILSIDNGYHEKHSINSMKKHLGVEDVHSCFDIYKLQDYIEHIKKNQPKKDDGDSGVPFKDDNKKEEEGLEIG